MSTFLCVVFEESCGHNSSASNIERYYLLKHQHHFLKSGEFISNPLADFFPYK